MYDSSEGTLLATSRRTETKSKGDKKTYLRNATDNARRGRLGRLAHQQAAQRNEITSLLAKNTEAAWYTPFNSNQSESGNNMGDWQLHTPRLDRMAPSGPMS